jgi:hypothetical protein
MAQRRYVVNHNTMNQTATIISFFFYGCRRKEAKDYTHVGIVRCHCRIGRGHTQGKKIHKGGIKRITKNLVAPSSAWRCGHAKATALYRKSRAPRRRLAPPSFAIPSPLAESAENQKRQQEKRILKKDGTGRRYSCRCRPAYGDSNGDR